MTDVIGLLKTATALERAGESMRAFDLVADAVEAGCGDLRLKYFAALCLARCGAVTEAGRAYRRWGLDRVASIAGLGVDGLDARAAQKLLEDVVAFGGRLLKDDLWRRPGPPDTALARQAAAGYGRAHDLTGGLFSGINTASLLLIAGEREQAGRIAADLLARIRPDAAPAGEDGYYLLATAAEAELVLGRVEAAAALLAQALARDPGNLSARASTLRQAERLLAAQGLDRGWLDRLRPPGTLHFGGHIFALGEGGGQGRRLLPDALAPLRETLRRAIGDLGPGAAFGALAAGADLLIAETLLEAGVRLHVVLPFREEDFLRASVHGIEGPWRALYRRCRDQAASVRLATDGPYLGDPWLFTYGSEMAMGQAILQADRIAAGASQLLLWDGQESGQAAGTAVDAGLWRATGRRQMVIPFPAPIPPHPAAAPGPRPEPASGGFGQRRLKAMLFADVKGFSRLQDDQLPAFVSQLMGAMAAVLEQPGLHPDYCNTWGDGLFVAFDDVVRAARAALALQQAFRAVDLGAAGLPDSLALRVGGHYGPVYQGDDPVQHRLNLFGAHVSLAARVEPVVPPGEIYVTDAFAAVLARRAVAGLQCEYVGEIEAAKRFGRLAIYHLMEA